MTRTLSVAALTLVLATSYTFAVTDGTISRAAVQPSPRVEKPLNVTCIQSALDKRESAIITAHNTYSGSITNSLTIRKDNLKAAWAKPTRTERKVARDAAWKTFKTSHKSAHEGLRSAQKTAWNTFDTDMKACGISKEAHGENPSISGTPIAL